MKKSFEDQWKDALGDASQAPPPEIWERVEAELDRKKSRFILWVIPVRMKPAILSGVAAAVTLALGTLFFVNYSATESGISQKAGTPAVPSAQESETGEIPEPAVTHEPVAATGDAHGGTLQTVHPAAPTLASQIITAQPEEVSLPVQSLSISGEKEVTPGNTAGAYPLSPLPFREMQAYAELPRVQEPEKYIPVSRKTPKEKKGWMSLIAANAPFNPNFSAPGFQQQALSAVQNSEALLSFDKSFVRPGTNGFHSNSHRTDALSSFKRGQSMSIGLMMGRRLKKRLSLESGVKFTRATATLTSNVYALNKLTGETESFSHANYIRSDNEMSDALISVNSNSHYSYHFLSVPLLLNYEVLNVGKLNVNAVGGLSSEFLLSGTVINSRQSEQSFNAGNSNFRPVSLAGVGGLRLSYPVTSMLEINLGGTYQHFITSGLQKGSDATFRPSMLGINLGMSVRR